MKILVTGFNGKVGYEVTQKLMELQIQIKCAVRDVNKAMKKYGGEYEFVKFDFSSPDTFVEALNGVDKVFLIYPPGKDIHFEEFIRAAKEKSVKHIVYLSLKDVQFLPFIHHFKNEKLIKKYDIPYTFLRAGYFMQNLKDFLYDEIKGNCRIFVPAGKGKTSFVDARDIAEVGVMAFLNPEKHKFKSYVITGEKAIDFFEVAKIMSEVIQKEISYSNPSVKEFKEYMVSKGSDSDFINVVVGVHIPTKLGLAKGVAKDFFDLTNKRPGSIRSYIEDYRTDWI